MESPSLVILKFSSQNHDALAAVMRILLDFGRSFYFSPRTGGVRVLLRSRSKMNAILNEVRGIEGIKIKRYFQ